MFFPFAGLVPQPSLLNGFSKSRAGNAKRWPLPKASSDSGLPAAPGQLKSCVPLLIIPPETGVEVTYSFFFFLLQAAQRLYPPPPSAAALPAEGLAIPSTSTPPRYETLSPRSPVRNGS